MSNAFPSSDYIHRSLRRSVLFPIWLLIVTVTVFATANSTAQEMRSKDPQSAADEGGEEAAVRRVVNGIMQPYLAQRQRTGARGQKWIRSSNLGAIVAVSLHNHRYFFAYGKATDSGAPFSRDTFWRSALAPKCLPLRFSR